MRRTKLPLRKFLPHGCHVLPKHWQIMIQYSTSTSLIVIQAYSLKCSIITGKCKITVLNTHPQNVYITNLRHDDCVVVVISIIKIQYMCIKLRGGMKKIVLEATIKRWKLLLLHLNKQQKQQNKRINLLLIVSKASPLHSSTNN